MENSNTLLSFYGARVSKDEKRINVSLCEGKGETRKFYCATVKLDNSGKIKCKITDDGKACIIKVPFFENKKETEIEDL